MSPYKGQLATEREMRKPKKGFSPGDRIRLVRDASGDLPPSLIGKRGNIIRFRQWDIGVNERYPHEPFLVAVYEVKMDDRKATLHLFEDEMRGWR